MSEISLVEQVERLERNVAALTQRLMVVEEWIDSDDEEDEEEQPDAFSFNDDAAVEQQERASIYMGAKHIPPSIVEYVADERTESRGGVWAVLTIAAAFLLSGWLITTDKIEPAMDWVDARIEALRDDEPEEVQETVPASAAPFRGQIAGYTRGDTPVRAGVPDCSAHRRTDGGFDVLNANTMTPACQLVKSYFATNDRQYLVELADNYPDWK